MAIRSSKNVVFSIDFIDDLFNSMIGGTWTPGNYGGGTIHLFKGALVPTPATLVADLIAAEATFGGYADVAIPATPSEVLTNPTQSAILASATFVAASLTGSETATGYYVLDDGGALWFSERFESGVIFAANGDFLNLDVFLIFNQLQTVQLAE